VITRSVTVAVLALLQLACAGERASADHLRVTSRPFIRFAPLFIAQDEGYFREQGLDVELVPLLSTRGGIAGLASGDLDVVGAFLSAGVFNAIARQGGIRIVAGRGAADRPGCPSFGIVARSELVTGGRLGPVSDLKGLRVSLRMGTVEEFYLERLLRPSGLTLADLVVENVPTAAKVGALASNKIDVVISGEPAISRIEGAGIGILWRPTADIVPGLEPSFLLFGPRLLETAPDLGRRFMLAFLQGVRQADLGATERNVAIVSRHTEIDPPVLHRMCWPAFSDHGRLATEGAMEFQRWAVASGYQDRIVPVDEFWEPAFVDFANQTLAALEDGEAVEPAE